ncbi:hypothetical protein BDV18DRAFT_162786 [Aspergillus unguis]
MAHNPTIGNTDRRSLFTHQQLLWINRAFHILTVCHRIMDFPQMSDTHRLTTPHHRATTNLHPLPSTSFLKAQAHHRAAITLEGIFTIAKSDFK